LPTHSFEAWRGGGGDADEAFADIVAGAGVGSLVIEELVGPVGFQAEGLDFVGEERGADSWLEVAGFLGFGYGAFEGANPLAHDGGDAIADRTTTVIKLKRCGSKKTASGKEFSLDVGQPAINQIPEARHTFGSLQSREGDLVDEDPSGGLDSGQLEVFLGAKMSEKAALAHLQVIGQTTHCEAFQAVKRGNIDGPAEDSLASAKTAWLAADG
jgi:hypothetical protein